MENNGGKGLVFYHQVLQECKNAAIFSPCKRNPVGKTAIHVEDTEGKNQKKKKNQTTGNIKNLCKQATDKAWTSRRRHYIHYHKAPTL